jgi:hypothetical protein
MPTGVLGYPFGRVACFALGWGSKWLRDNPLAQTLFGSFGIFVKQSYGVVGRHGVNAHLDKINPAQPIRIYNPRDAWCS